MSLTLTEGEDTKKKKCRLLAPNAEKRVQKFGGKDEKRGRLVGKRMDALFATLLLCSQLSALSFFFFLAEAPLCSRRHKKQHLF
jgi:hypothetical protein